jgi:phage antirepressor YoqD-like protein
MLFAHSFDGFLFPYLPNEIRLLQPKLYYHDRTNESNLPVLFRQRAKWTTS